MNFNKAEPNGSVFLVYPIMARRRNRRKPNSREIGLAQLRGYWEEPDLSKYTRDASTLVDAAMKGMGLEQRFNEEQVFEAWGTLVNPFVAEHARPVALERKTLYIQVLHSAIHYELERMKGQILGKMQKEFGAENIRQIRFRLG